MSKILLKNANRLGDILMMTCAVRDFKTSYPEYEIKVDTPFKGIWQNNPYLSDFSIPDEVVNIGPGTAVQKSNSNGLHFCNGYRLSIEKNIGLEIKQGPIKPDLHMNKGELKQGPIIKGKYWLITAGSNGDFQAKIWPFERWQEVVDRNQDINFVQIGHSLHPHEVLDGKNVINMIGKTDDEGQGLRDLMNLFYYCEGSLGIVSMQMHMAAAFDKPCVVVAGGREPASFEAYNIHRYLHNQGSLKCSGKSACWAKELGKCEKANNLIEGTPKCLWMITVDDVCKAIDSYYVGGRLTKGEDKKPIEIKNRPIFKMVCNGQAWGGGERSPAWIMNRMYEKGYKVEMVPRNIVCDQFRDNIPNIKITNKLTSPCDILMLYANDMIWDFLKPDFDPFNHIQAKKKVMCLNYRNGKAGQGWSKDWDLYLFLNTDAEQGFLKKHPGHNTRVLPPPVDLKPFMNGFIPNYNGPFKFVRHSSQGDVKYHEDTEKVIRSVLKDYPDSEFYLMPAPSFLPEIKGVYRYPEYSMDVPKFLSKGNIFWYMLPDGYVDSGPRVIMEAMAMGLPVIADLRGGARDRIDFGFVRDWERLGDFATDFNLTNMGLENRERAKTFDPELWIDAIEEINGR